MAGGDEESNQRLQRKFKKMKNEDKIVELLAETLRKQDRQEELLQMHTKLLQNQGNILQNQGNILDRHTSILDRHTSILDRHTSILERHTSLMERQGDILERQGDILERHEAQLKKLVEGQDVMAGELKGLRSDFHKMNDHLLTRLDQTDERIKRSEDRDAKDR